jgi:acyl-CoA dehydrogenase
MYAPTTGDHPVAQIERALAATLAAEPIEAKIRAAAKEGKFDAKVPPGGGLDVLVTRAQAAGVITATEAAAVIAARDLTAKVIRVDDFPQDLGLSEMQAPHHDGAAPAPAVMHKAAA